MASIDFDYYVCGLSNREDKHYIISEPIKLLCGHFCCTKCCQKCTKIDEVCCVLCGKQMWNDSSVSSDTDDTSFLDSLENNFTNICNEIDIQFRKTLDTFKEKKSIALIKVNYLKEEIDVRIESLKIELDKHGDELKKKLDDIKQDIENDKNDDFESNDDFQIVKIDNSSKKMKIDEDKLKLEQKFNKLQDTILEIKDSIKGIENKCQYQINEHVFTSDLIMEPIQEEIEKVISRCPKFFRPFAITDLCILPNGHFCFITKTTISIYNNLCEYVNETTPEISRIDDFVCVTSDNQNNIYVIDDKNQLALKFNSELKEINRARMNYPLICGGIHYYNNNLYLSGISSGYEDSSMVIKLTTDLKIVLEKEIKGHFQAILNGVLCSLDSIFHFYKLETFETICHYNCKESCETVNVFTLDNKFYAQNEEFNVIYIFNDQGELINKVKSTIRGYLCDLSKMVDYNRQCFIIVRDYVTDQKYVMLV